MRTRTLIGVLALLACVAVLGFAVNAKPGEDVKVYTTPADYQKASGKAVPAYKEAPMLADLVKAGKLPKVADRLPKEPSVIDPWEAVGTYGGTVKIHKSFLRDVLQRGLLQQSSDGSRYFPDLAKEIKYTSADYRQVTVYLRQGVRWSDGDPFDADDIMFWWEYELNDKDITPSGPSGAYKDAKFTKVDQYTVRIDFKDPQPTWLPSMSHPYSLSQSFFYEPKHFMQQYHLKTNKDANELAKKEGYKDWVEAFRYHAGTWVREQRANHPTLDPWIVKEITSTYTVCERNPYFWQVDTAGNQLPYIDKVIGYVAADPQTAMMQMMSGQWDYVSGFSTLGISDYSVLKENEKKGNYRVVTQYGDFMSNMTLTLNPLGPDPVIQKLIRDLRFRQAISIALDRKAMADSIFFGLAEPRQQAPLPSVKFYKDEWSTWYTQYDPAKANQLLDEMGLKWDADKKWRLRPDGKQLEILALSGHGNQIAIDFAEIIAQQLAKVGIKFTFKSEKATSEIFINDKWDAMLCDNGGGSTDLANVGTTPAFSWWNAFGWQNWLNTEGKGTYVVEPPAEWKEVQQWTLQAASAIPYSAQWTELKQKIWDRKVKALYDIGTVYKAPVIDVVSNRLRNYPEQIWFGWSSGIHVVLQSQQWFLK